MTTSEENNSNPTQEQCSNIKFHTRQKRFKVKEERKEEEAEERKEKGLLNTKTLTRISN
jgi:hypothetical protein